MYPSRDTYLINNNCYVSLKPVVPALLARSVSMKPVVPALLARSVSMTEAFIR